MKQKLILSTIFILAVSYMLVGQASVVRAVDANPVTAPITYAAYSIAGRVTLRNFFARGSVGTPAPGITVTVRNVTNKQIYTGTTDSNGNYIIGVPTSGNYMVSVSKPGNVFLFNPPLQVIRLNGNKVGVDFQGLMF